MNACVLSALLAIPLSPPARQGVYHAANAEHMQEEVLFTIHW